MSLSNNDVHTIAVAAKAVELMLLNPLETRESLKKLLGEAKNIAKFESECKPLARRTVEALTAFVDEKPSKLFTEYTKLFHSIKSREALCPPFASEYSGIPLNTLLMSLQMLYARAALETRVRDPEAMEHVAALLELYSYLLERVYRGEKYFARVARDLLRTVLQESLEGLERCLEHKARLPQYVALGLLIRELAACSRKLASILSQPLASGSGEESREN